MPHVPPMIQFDPKASTPSDDEEDDDDDGGSRARPKKRKSVANLRQAAGGSKVEDKDEGRRKIQIEYIEEKSKRRAPCSLELGWRMSS
jgi:hypothetical protein